MVHQPSNIRNGKTKYSSASQSAIVTSIYLSIGWFDGRLACSFACFLACVLVFSIACLFIR